MKNTLSYRNASHRIHTDINPVISAIRHKKLRIAAQRYQALCDKLNMTRWESVVVANLIRSKCVSLNIPWPSSTATQ